MPHKYLWLAGILLLGTIIAAEPIFAQSKPNGCRASQLRAIRPDWDDGGLSHQSVVVQVTNSTQQPCQLTGPPRLRLLDASENPINIPICPNCTDYTFQAKPAEPVVLRRGESAYFLLGYTVDLPGRPCGQVARLDVLFADGKSRRIDLNRDAAHMAPACDINTSAWRKGPFNPHAQ